MQTRKPRHGDRLEVTIERVDEKGHGIGRAGAFTIRVRKAVPGDRLAVRVLRRRRDVVDASREELLEAGPDAEVPRCAHFGSCGGCSFQGLAYDAQLQQLEGLIERTLEALDTPPSRPVVGCDSPWGYRNKMDFTFARRRWIEADEPQGAPDGFAVGLHVPGRFDKVIDVGTCEIAFPEASPILATARSEAQALELEPWDVREHTGLLRHLVLRKGEAWAEIMANLVTTEMAAERVDPLVERILRAHPEITTFVQNVNPGVAMVATGVEERVLFGPGTIRERLGGVEFRISANSFFQTNTLQAERLVATVLEEAAAAPGDVVYDLYCGCGTFALALAARGIRALGFEYVEAAVRDAEANARSNGIEGASFVAGDLAETLDPEPLRAAGHPAPRVCVVDPPRAGMHSRVVAALDELDPERIVYVSCNPKSAARDIALLELRYTVKSVRPIDLFPHTPHLECVFTLERKL